MTMRYALGTAVFGAVLLVGPGAWGGTHLQKPGTIRITSKELKDTVVDLGVRGRSPGDIEVVRELLYNTRVTPKAIGHAELVCTYTVNASRNCNGTYFLPKGKIVVGGAMFYRALYELAVLGGTGLYDNVRGSVIVTLTGEKPRREVLIFRLTV
jgi:hypothetical protein